MSAEDSFALAHAASLDAMARAYGLPQRLVGECDRTFRVRLIRALRREQDSERLVRVWFHPKRPDGFTPSDLRAQSVVLKMPDIDSHQTAVLPVMVKLPCERCNRAREPRRLWVLYREIDSMVSVVGCSMCFRYEVEAEKVAVCAHPLGSAFVSVFCRLPPGFAFETAPAIEPVSFDAYRKCGICGTFSSRGVGPRERGYRALSPLRSRVSGVEFGDAGLHCAPEFPGEAFDAFAASAFHHWRRSNPSWHSDAPVTPVAYQTGDHRQLPGPEVRESRNAPTAWLRRRRRQLNVPIEVGDTPALPWGGSGPDGAPRYPTERRIEVAQEQTWAEEMSACAHTQTETVGALADGDEARATHCLDCGHIEVMPTK